MPAQIKEGQVIALDPLTETWQVLGPAIAAVVRQLGLDVGVLGAEIAGEVERFLEVAGRAVVKLLRQDRIVAAQHAGPLLQVELELALERLLEEAPRRRKGAIDPRLVDPVIADIEEPGVARRLVDLPRRRAACRGTAGERFQQIHYRDEFGRLRWGVDNHSTTSRRSDLEWNACRMHGLELCPGHADPARTRRIMLENRVARIQSVIR